MPERMLRDWRDSERIDRVSAGAETLFVRLIMSADDFGRFVAKPRLLISICYPLKPSLSEKQISCWTDELEKAGLVRLYQVSGKKYLEILGFNQRLRAKRSRYPDPVASKPAVICPQPADKCQQPAVICPQPTSGDASDKGADPHVSSTSGRDTPPSQPQTCPPETDTDTETDTEEIHMCDVQVGVSPGIPAGRVRKVKRTDPYSPEFERFWTDFPVVNQSPKGSKWEAWEAWKAVTEMLSARGDATTDAAALLTKAAKDRRGMPAEGSDIHTKHVCRWLKCRCWESDPPPAAGAPTARQEPRPALWRPSEAEIAASAAEMKAAQDKLRPELNQNPEELPL